MDVPTTLFILFLTFYVLTFLKYIFSKKERVKKQSTNIKLNELRKVSYKSLEEQKEFLNTKYPVSEPWKFTWKGFFKFIYKLILFIAVMRFFKWIWMTLFGDYNLALGWVLLFIVVFPILCNRILKIFNLEGDDLLVYIK